MTTMTLEDIKTSLLQAERDQRHEKARLREKIRRDTEAFLESGGEITRVDSGERGGQQWAGYNRELLNQQVDMKEVAAMLGTNEVAIKTATRYGKLWGLKFPTPLPQKTADGRTMFKLPEITKFREKTRKAVQNGKAA